MVLDSILQLVFNCYSYCDECMSDNTAMHHNTSQYLWPKNGYISNCSFQCIQLKSQLDRNCMSFGHNRWSSCTYKFTTHNSQSHHCHQCILDFHYNDQKIWYTVYCCTEMLHCCKWLKKMVKVHTSDRTMCSLLYFSYLLQIVCN